MIFLKTSKQEILQCIGEVLEKSYGKDYYSVLPMFADTDCPMPEIFKEPSEERNKQLEDRFLYCITEAAIKDNFEELQAFLKDILERLRKSYVNLRTVGYKWLIDFLCDDKKSFLHFYNPQNEMLTFCKTKCSNSKTKRYYFRPPYNYMIIALKQTSYPILTLLYSKIYK